MPMHSPEALQCLELLGVFALVRVQDSMAMLLFACGCATAAWVHLRGECAGSLVKYLRALQHAVVYGLYQPAHRSSCTFVRLVPQHKWSGSL
jgi:hypothetical protein